jgi:hypothetical protein
MDKSAKLPLFPAAKLKVRPDTADSNRCQCAHSDSEDPHLMCVILEVCRHPPTRNRRAALVEGRIEWMGVPGHPSATHKVEKRLKRKVGNDPTRGAESMLARLRFIPSIPRHKLPDRPPAGISNWPKVKTSKGPTIQPWASGTQDASTSAQHPSPGAAVARALMELPLRTLHDNDTERLPLFEELNRSSNVCISRYRSRIGYLGPGSLLMKTLNLGMEGGIWRQASTEGDRSAGRGFL